jgi:hypothetical protein
MTVPRTRRRRTAPRAPRPDVVTIYRVERADTGEGAYCFMYPGGNRRTAHPARYCPAPREDHTLRRLMDATFDAWHGQDAGRVPLGGYDVALLDRSPWTDDAWRIFSRRGHICPWHFGFPSLVHFRAWFSPDDRATARRVGLVLAVYEAHPSAVLVGDTQAVFFMPTARRVAVLPIPR